MNGRRVLWIAAAAGLAVAAVSASRRAGAPARAVALEANAPWGRAVAATRGALATLRDGVLRAPAAAARVRELEAENAALRARDSLAEALRAENARLREEAGFSSRRGRGGRLASALGGRLVPCETLSAGGTDPWRTRLLLSRGTLSGIALGQAVVAPEGLVGRVVEVTPTSAVVLPLCDPESRVAVEIKTRSGAPARAILSGSGYARGDRELEALRVAAPFTADWIGKDAATAPGDRVFTSGLGGAFPPGLPVGRVVAAEPDETRLWQRARVAPEADFHALRRVFVLVPADAAGGGGVAP